MRDQTAYVRPGKGGRATVPRWGGGRMPLSTTLADAMVELMGAAAEGRFDGPEMQRRPAAARIAGALVGAADARETLLAETLKTRDGWHLFLYPFAGRNVHLGLASLIAWRAGQIAPGVFSLAVNDYGLEAFSAGERDWAAELPALLDASLSLEALMRETFGEPQRGRTDATALPRHRPHLRPHPAPPIRRRARTARQLQASSGLFYDVFRKYDPGHALIRQAEREVLEAELDVKLIAENLARMAGKKLVVTPLERCSPLAFPLMVEGFREKLSNEAFAERVERMAAALEKAAAR